MLSSLLGEPLTSVVCIDGPGEAPLRYSAEDEQAPQDSSDGSEHDISAPDEPPQSATEARITDPGLPPPEILPGGLLSTGNSMLDGILLYSQQRLLDRIDEITSGMHVSVTRSLSMGPPAGDAVTLHSRLAELEHSQARLLSATRDVHMALSRLRTKVHDVGLWEGDVLLSIQQEVEPITKRDQVLDDLEDDGYASAFGLPVRVILLGGSCSAVALAVRRFRRPVHDKIV